MTTPQVESEKQKACRMVQNAITYLCAVWVGDDFSSAANIMDMDIDYQELASGLSGMLQYTLEALGRERGVSGSDVLREFALHIAEAECD
jgi:hypothetical protein